MRTMILLVACTAMASCYAVAGPQDGTREVSALDQGAVVPDGGNDPVPDMSLVPEDSAPTEETASSQPTAADYWVTVVPGEWERVNCDAVTYCDSCVREITVEKVNQQNPYHVAACPTARYFLGGWNTAYGSLCLEDDGSLTYCKTDHLLCEESGMPRIYDGMGRLYEENGKRFAEVLMHGAENPSRWVQRQEFMCQ